MGTKIKLFVSENLKEKIKTSSKLFNVTQGNNKLQSCSTISKQGV